MKAIVALILTTALAQVASATPAQATAALDDLDAVVAPIWKLSAKDSAKTMCTAWKNMKAKSDHLAGSTPPASVKSDAWKTATDDVTSAVTGLQLCCNNRPKGLSPAMQAAQDSSDRDCLDAVHDALGKAIALVPGASPLDSHANAKKK
jgi:hypothetical protein